MLHCCCTYHEKWKKIYLFWRQIPKLRARGDWVMYQFVFNEANRQGIQTVVMIVRTDIDNGLPSKLTRPGGEDCGDCDDSRGYRGEELVLSAELVVISGHERSNVSTITTPSHFLLALISTHAGLCQFYQHRQLQRRWGTGQGLQFCSIKTFPSLSTELQPQTGNEPRLTLRPSDCRACCPPLPPTKRDIKFLVALMTALGPVNTRLRLFTRHRPGRPGMLIICICIIMSYCI